MVVKAFHSLSFYTILFVLLFAVVGALLVPTLWTDLSLELIFDQLICSIWKVYPKKIYLSQSSSSGYWEKNNNTQLQMFDGLVMYIIIWHTIWLHGNSFGIYLCINLQLKKKVSGLVAGARKEEKQYQCLTNLLWHGTKCCIILHRNILLENLYFTDPYGI